MSRSHGYEDDNGDGWGGAEDTLANPDEQKALFRALDSFYQYAKIAHYNTTHVRRQSFYALPQAEWQFLAGPPFNYLETLEKVDDAIDQNAELSLAILLSGLDSFGICPRSEKENWKGTATPSDLDKARSTIRQFYRDWSAEGAKERDACLRPVIEDLAEERIARQGALMRILVPGAGLGRLVFELCKRGFNTEGNEISYHQLLASSYVLNHVPGPRAHTLYPWIHGFSNHLDRSNHLQAVKIPDVHVSTISQQGSTSGEMSMSASDFITLYEKSEYTETFDAVASVFFLDTARNPLRYIRAMRNCLKRGGIWVNLGPLLWHFENHSAKKSDPGTSQSKGIVDPGSVELTNEEVILLVEKLGFKVEKRETGLEAGYIQNPDSMLQSLYKVSHWVARKL